MPTLFATERNIVLSYEVWGAGQGIAVALSSSLMTHSEDLAATNYIGVGSGGGGDSPPQLFPLFT